jgi:2-dehydro-3-deoxy-D-gluconate 5-dehydrogenase
MILNSFSVAGKNALVTGSTRGLGAAIAIALAEAGANVAVHGRLGTGEDTGSSIRQMGRKTISLAGDVADPKVCSALIQKAIDEFGSLDILVNNAGMIRRAPAVDYTSADWDQLIATNLSIIATRRQTHASTRRRREDRKHSFIVVLPRRNSGSCIRGSKGRCGAIDQSSCQ